MRRSIRQRGASREGRVARTRRQTPDGFEQRLLARARAAGFTAHDRIVVGFSGGRDSLALAAALRWVQAVPRRRAGARPRRPPVASVIRRRSEASRKPRRVARPGVSGGCGLDATDRRPSRGRGRGGGTPRALPESLRGGGAVRRTRGRDGASSRRPGGDGAAASAARGRGARGSGDGRALAIAVPDPAPPRDISQENQDMQPWLWRPF